MKQENLNSDVNHPSHYNQGDIECIDAMQSAFGNDEVLTFCKLNAFKYIWRANSKGDALTDLKKAEWYLSRAVAQLSTTRPISEMD